MMKSFFVIEMTFKLPQVLAQLTWKLGIFSFHSKHASKSWMLQTHVDLLPLRGTSSTLSEIELLAFYNTQNVGPTRTYRTTPHLHDPLRLPNCIRSLLSVHPQQPPFVRATSRCPNGHHSGAFRPRTHNTTRLETRR